MERNIILIIGLVLAAFQISCKENKITMGTDASFIKKENILYAEDRNPELTMDLYTPEKHSRENKDVFIIIHGGGWRGGNKSELTLFTLSMMKKFPHSVFANINYRLASTSRYALPNQIDDIRTAMNYVEKAAGFQPRFILLGNSAGGHLSMLYAYKFDPDKKVKAVINIVGPADLSDPGFKRYDDYSFLENHLVDPKAAYGSPMAYASPVAWISSHSAPTLSYYGINDQVVPFTQKNILDSVLSKNKVLHESYEFTGGHSDWYQGKNGEFLIGKVEAFLKKL
ncbi:alpha/beta hydrolase [Chryseobacterium camelliae]|uniref:alpha/beta hydrolase n=1 Tax=Chryseobacterium camelliae TaxID=1265445 RepID=UPI000C1C9D91|nr:alpha/beta hydrolase [Chryseobacterium camelliae]